MSRQRKIHIVLTGGTGYTGSAILRKAADTYADSLELRTLVRKHKKQALPAGSTVVEGALPDDISARLFPREPHILIHFATKTMDHDGSGFRENERNINALLSYLPDTCSGVIYGSSMSVYGQGIQDGVTEDAPLRPETPLAESRADVERIIMEEMQGRNKNAFILRPRFVLGGNDRYTLPSWMNMIQNRFMLGSGRQKFSIIHVDDYAEIVLRLALSMHTRYENGTPLCTPFNIGYAQPITLKEITDIIREEKDLPKPTKTIPVGSMFFKTLRRIPYKPLQNMITGFELGGLSHFGNINAVMSEIGSDIINKNPKQVFTGIVKNYRDG